MLPQILQGIVSLLPVVGRKDSCDWHMDAPKLLELLLDLECPITQVERRTYLDLYRASKCLYKVFLEGFWLGVKGE